MLLYFDCPFDEARDDYPDVFKVALLRGTEASSLPEDWRKLDLVANLGSIPVSAVHFDETRRREAVIEGLPRLVAIAESAYNEAHLDSRA